MLGAFLQLLRIALAAGVLLTGVPAWQHAHAAGDKPHGHHHERDHEHNDDGMGDCHSHIHFWLLGVVFTLPVESDEGDSHEDQATFLVASPTVMDAVQPLHFFSPAFSILQAGEPARIEARFRCIAASVAPLCDAARHERSGVLLV